MRWAHVLAVVGCAAACSAFDGTSNMDGPAKTDGGASDGGASDGHGGLAGPATDLATNQQTPGGLVLDDTNVYWLNQASSGKPGAVMKMAKGGGTPIVLAHDIAAPYAITSDATRLYFSANESNGGSYQFLYLQDKGGGSPQRLQLNANDQVFGCSVQGGDVFWTLQSSGGTVGFVDTTSWTLTSVVTIETSVGAVKTVVADPTHLFVGVTGKIVMITRSDKQESLFANVADVVKALALDETTVFWADATSVRALDKSSPGAEPRVLADAQDGPSALAIDGANVYWATAGDGAIRRVAKGGGAVTTLASGESEPLGIAIDGSGLYWTNNGDGRVRTIRP